MAPEEYQVGFGNYIPNQEGWPYTLPDEVSTCIRLHCLGDGGFDIEWLIAQRDIDIPEELNLETATKRMVEKFRFVHRPMKFSEAALKVFSSYSVYFNITVHTSREEEDVDGGASYGARPWKLGMFAAALTLWDIQWRQHNCDPPPS